MAVLTYRAEEFSDELFRDRTETVSVLIPAHNEAKTIGHIAATVAGMVERGLIDQVLVVADRCSDDTIAIARHAGAEVIDSRELEPHLGATQGKGDVLWRGLARCRGELVAFVDGDSGPEFGEHFVHGLIGPMLLRQEIGFVKACYDKPFRAPDGTLTPRRSGRVSQLMAEPALGLLFPDVHGIEQPLAGEFAARKEVFEGMSFPCAYGVDIWVLLQAWRELGPEGIAQCDLGMRQNRHHDIQGLQKMSSQVLAAMLAYRFGGDAVPLGTVRPARRR